MKIILIFSVRLLKESQIKTKGILNSQMKEKYLTLKKKKRNDCTNTFYKIDVKFNINKFQNTKLRITQDNLYQK